MPLQQDLAVPRRSCVPQKMPSPWPFPPAGDVPPPTPREQHGHRTLHRAAWSGTLLVAVPPRVIAPGADPSSSSSRTPSWNNSANPEVWIALATLTALELVLGIDNIIFISILAGKLPPQQRDKARRLGIMLAAVSRLGLLLAIAWIVGLTAPLFSLFGHAFSWRDIILIGGGLFLIGKATHEIHQKLEGATEQVTVGAATATFGGVIVQIMLLDIVFSLDSIITAVGMVDQRWVMVTAILASIVFMLMFARALGEFVERHPTVKVLALSFLIMIGLVLMADGFGQHIPKGYIYAAMAFSVFVELINLAIHRRAQRRVAPVALHEKYAPGE
ncbi:hypothetical protein RLIN73S_07288 [Rhodanobacter lindaniclasticus]